MAPTASGTAGPVPNWVNVAPSDMSYEDLAEARRAVQARLDELNTTMAWLNAANMRLSYEVSTRFNIPIPGLPPVTQMAIYPADQVRSYAWPDSSTD